MTYLLVWCLPSFLLSLFAILFTRRELGKQRSFWFNAILVGYVPFPILAFFAMFGLGLMREVEMSKFAALAFIVGWPLIGCSIGVVGAILVGQLKPVNS